MLLALNQLWNLGLDMEQLMKVAGELGSDVPFFLGKGVALCSGRGEMIESAPLPRARCCVLILPPYSLSTREVYGRFDEMREDRRQETEDRKELIGGDAALIMEWARLPAEELMRRLFNDLEAAAFSIRPELGLLRETLERALARVVRMSGSGSTLFTLADEMAEGETLAERARKTGVRAEAVEIGV
jgi:4-diphosphocytidyl-2C-methyl-D-erythritol kinase